MASNQPTHAYGTSKDMFVTRKVGSDGFIIGGTGDNDAKWTRVLTQRAAQLLWHQLLQQLFPEKSQTVKSLAVTAPMRNASLPTVTAHLVLNVINDHEFEIMGWAGQNVWQTTVNIVEARLFWTNLDKVLYPTGWQG